MADPEAAHIYRSWLQRLRICERFPQPDWSIAEVTRCIKTINPDVKVLVLNLSDDYSLLSGCLDAGASGYIRKDDDASQLRNAIGAACGHGNLKTFVA